MCGCVVVDGDGIMFVEFVFMDGVCYVVLDDVYYIFFGVDDVVGRAWYGSFVAFERWVFFVFDLL